MKKSPEQTILSAFKLRGALWIAELAKETDISYQRCVDVVGKLLRERKITCIGTVSDLPEKPARIKSDSPVYALTGTPMLTPAKKREPRRKKYKGEIVGKPYRVDWRMSGDLCRDIFINKRMAEGAR